jgi:adenylylsulfate kinase-like enzyme
VQGPRVAAELRFDERDREEIARRLSVAARLLAQGPAPKGE